MLKYGSYHRTTTFDGMEINYSVDMVRYSFKYDFDSPICSDFQRLYDKLSDKIETNLFRTSKAFQYTNLFVFTVGECVIKVGIGLNGINREDNFKCFLEYNPNKVDVDLLNMIVETLRPCCLKRWLSLSRWDLAIDIPVERSQACFYKDRRDYAYFKSARKGITTYLGKRLSEGFTKLYDKTKESDLDYDLTRLEITFGDSDLPTMPDVYIDGGQTNLMVALSGTNRVLALLLNQLDETDFQTYYGMLNYKLRKKLEPHVKKGKKLEYDYKVIYELMMDIKKFEKEFNIDDDFHNLKFMNIESPFFNA